MSKKLRQGTLEEGVSPNLIPMIDIMFLLLLFFMLGADMSQRELTAVILPEASEVQEAKNEREKGAEYLTLNIHPMRDATSEQDAMSPTFRDESNWRFAI